MTTKTRLTFVFLIALSSAVYSTARGSGTTTSLVVRNEPVRAVLLNLAQRFGKSIVVPDDVRGFITVSLRDATIDQALGAVLKPLGYAYARNNGVIVVTVARGARSTSVTTAPAVLPVSVVSVNRAANVLRAVFPQATIRVDASANALIVTAPAEDLQGMRTILQGIDVRNPTQPITQAFQLHLADPTTVANRLSSLYPTVRVSIGPNKSLLVKGSPTDLAQVKDLITAIDAPAATPSPSSAGSTEAIRVTQASPKNVAHVVSNQFQHVRASVSGSTVVLSGSTDEVTKAKALVAQIDVPNFSTRYTAVYRFHSVDAASAGDFITKSFRGAEVSVDSPINAISVLASVAVQQRVADAVKEIEQSQAGAGQAATAPGIAAGASNVEIVTLRSAIPGQGGNANDASGALVQTLQQLVPNVRIASLGTPGQIVLIGDPYSLKQAKDLLAKIDVPAALVVLDTEVLEIDENIARNVGLMLNPPLISSTFGELLPTPDPVTGQQRLINLGAITRTPIQFQAELNLLVQNGKARVLADPRVTTLSGRTATIHAGDTLNILTTVGGGVGTVATTQLQSFQTGVSLDITPLVTSDGMITVALHPVVNSLTAILNGVPQISTRDTQTVVHLKNDQTLVIGGLIQENNQRTENKIPVLGDIPLLGKLFQNNETNSTRNELIIVVTPHIVVDGEPPVPPKGPLLRAIPTPAGLPTIPPDYQLPPSAQHTPAPRRTPIDVFDPTTPAAGTMTFAGAPSIAAVSPGVIASPTTGAATTAGSGNFVYGRVPTAGNVAAAHDPPRIFYATVDHTILVSGVTVSVAAITTTNVVEASAHYGSVAVSMNQAAPGDWRAQFPFTTAAFGTTDGPQQQLMISAKTVDGTMTSVQAPITISRP